MTWCTLNHFHYPSKEMGKEGLNDDVTIVPVGGADKIATFISLMRGNGIIYCVLAADTLRSKRRSQIKTYAG